MFAYRVIVLFLGFLCLSNCGFRPLYQQADESLQLHLNRIKIQTIADREGQLLHNQLSTILTPKGMVSPALYSLSTSLKFQNQGVAFQKDASTSQESTALTFHISLTNIKTGKVLYSTSETISITNSLSQDSPYSNMIEERSAKKRLVQEAGHSIRLHLASFFSSLPQ
ncbi:MAG: hypothetical protein ACK5PQ_03420 [Alphaproteobacteria bacterium]